MRRMTWMTLAGGFALTAASAIAQEPIDELAGANPGDAFGVNVTSGGDLDGDGANELLITTRALDPFGTTVWAVQVRSGRDRSLLRTHFAAGADSLGASALFLDDVDGDGVADYVLDDPDPAMAARHALVFSGAGGTLIRSIPLTGSMEDLSPHLLALGDVDGDGIGDFAASDTSGSGGAVDVVSTGTGTVLRTLTGPVPWFAGDVTTLPDRDGDGLDELAISDVLQVGKNGVVWIYSAATGAKLDEFDGQRGDGFADSVARLRDINGDGQDELMVGAVRASGAYSRSGAVYVYSGGTHKVLYRLDGMAQGSGFGRNLIDAGDVNGDGFHDIAVGAPFVYGGGYFGPAFLFSGPTGGLLYRFEFPPTMNWSPNVLANLGDVDGDGLADLAIGDPETDLVPPGAGRLRMYAGNDLHLLATPRAPGASQPLALVTREGTSSELVLTALVDVNGAPTFLPLAFTTFDATGASALAGIVPPGLAGNVMVFQSFAQQSPRGVRFSAREIVTFQ